MSSNCFGTNTLPNENFQRNQFLEELNSLMTELGRSISKMPVMGYRELDLYTFYNEVQQFGGYGAATDKVGTWSKIWKRLGNFDTSITDASYRLRKNYERFLLEYEYRKFPERRRDETGKTSQRKRSRRTNRSPTKVTKTSSLPLVMEAAQPDAESREPVFLEAQKKRRFSTEDVTSPTTRFAVSQGALFDQTSQPSLAHQPRRATRTLSAPQTFQRPNSPFGFNEGLVHQTLITTHETLFSSNSPFSTSSENSPSSSFSSCDSYLLPSNTSFSPRHGAVTPLASLEKGYGYGYDLGFLDLDGNHIADLEFPTFEPMMEIHKKEDDNKPLSIDEKPFDVESWMF